MAGLKAIKNDPIKNVDCFLDTSGEEKDVLSSADVQKYDVIWE